MSKTTQNMFARDLRICLALADARKAENAAARRRAQANPELCAVLLESAKRRGESTIDWPEYFRNSYMVD
jgi:predicted solute-binding protein